MEDSTYTAQQFLTELTPEERARLYNDLLGIKDVYLCNKDTSFYTFRKIRRATKRHAECRKKTAHYQTNSNHELLINQIHEQKVFKNQYRIQVVFNTQEYNYDFIDYLLNLLHSLHFTNTQALA
ncbi:hypothetical protein [Enterococcus sp. DIV0660C]|uniref:hypothetical protein n=1 Tax=Enterococcus sp. DIV0660C TaxID=2230880 RepID=UPI001A8E53C4|nr:hypothetical protein [Enterococcus sp. DIV0660C]MBO0431660.1 hypothetical protein [Enterococcus sp. DIV0660C]